MATADPVYNPARSGGGGGSSISQLTWNSGTETLQLTEDGNNMWSVQQQAGANYNDMVLNGADGTGGMTARAYNGNGVDIFDRNAPSVYANINNTEIGIRWGSYSATIDALGTHVAGPFSQTPTIVVDANQAISVVMRSTVWKTLTAARTGTLPALSTCSNGQRFTVGVDSTATVLNKVTVTCAGGGDTINGAASLVLDTPWESYELEAQTTQGVFQIIGTGP